MVPALSIAFMALSLVLSIAIPAALLIILKKKTGSSVGCFFIGCAVFVVFALILESTMHSFVLGGELGERLRENLWLYGLYGAFAAGIFEELGRFFAFKVLMRKSERLSDSLMYGAGHGGVEAVLVLGMAMLSNIILSLLINSGVSLPDLLSASGDDAAASLEPVVTILTTSPPATFLMGIVERISAMTFHIALSVLVYIAAKRKGRLLLLPAAILLHAGLDLISVVCSGYGMNAWLIEGLIIVFTIVTVLLARALYKKEARASRQTDSELILNMGESQ